MTASNHNEEMEPRLGELFESAEKACNEGVSTSDFEPAFVRLLEFIERHPECYASAERRFLSGLSNGSMSWELVSFCMHSLRMQAVKDKVRSLLDEGSEPRDMGPLSHILASFKDDWEDAVMYEYYGSRA
jgi:hypothetical protein